ILLNLSIVAACTLLRDRKVPRLLQALLVCVLLASPEIVIIARLAWFDTTSENDSHLEAVAANGQTWRVPSNYFQSFSLLFAQDEAGWPFPGHFATGNMGTTSSPSIMREANNCALPVGTESGIGQSPGRPALERFVGAFHRYVLA